MIGLLKNLFFINSFGYSPERPYPPLARGVVSFGTLGSKGRVFDSCYKELLERLPFG